MVVIKVIIKSSLKRIMGLSEIEMTLAEGSSIMDLIISMGEKYGKSVTDVLIDKKSAKSNVFCILNDVMCKSSEVLNDGDVITFIPPLVGG